MPRAQDIFDLGTLSFPGPPVEQARFLLRKVRPLGNVDSSLASLPEILKAMLEGRVPVPSVVQLRKVGAVQSLDEKEHLGGDLDEPVSMAGASPALYFVIHDTSSPTLSFGSSFPLGINTPAWSGNKLQTIVSADPVAHVFVNRAGESLSAWGYGRAGRATKFESKIVGDASRGRFLHTELVQPRINNKRGIDEFSPDPGFSAEQLSRLALLYLCASVRAKQWLIPAFHCVLDEGIANGHDDPQGFSLGDWGTALSALANRLGEGQISSELGSEPGSPPSTAHPAFRDLAILYAAAEIEFPALKSVTLAHWALASNWGNSRLATKLFNFANLPYREEMAAFAQSEFETTDDGAGNQWCDFHSMRGFIAGYWHWLEREPYEGWRTHTTDAHDFMEFVGKIYAGDADSYAPRVLALLPMAEALLSQAHVDTLDVSLLTDTRTVPLTAMVTSDGYTPPVSSQDLLKTIGLDQAVRVGGEYVKKFAKFDDTAQGRRDPSRCRGLYRFPSGALYWESKMAVDADGSPTPSVLDSSSGSSPNTSIRFADQRRNSVNAEVVPYFVLPQPDRNDGLDMAQQFSIKLGALGVVIYGNKITGAIFADAGPAFKIGEASIRVHELVRKAPAPWKGDPAKKMLLDASVESGVVYIVFPGTTFDINAFGAGKQKEMANAIHQAAMIEYVKLSAGGNVTGPDVPAFFTAAGTGGSGAAPQTGRRPTKALLFASAWHEMALELGVKATSKLKTDDDWAVAAIETFAGKYSGQPVMIGFDSGNVAGKRLKAALARARSLPNCELEIYVEGPGGPTGDHGWSDDEKERIRFAAKSIGIDGSSFDDIIDAWDDGKWWDYTSAQLESYKKEGFAAAEIDNIGRVSSRFPGGLTGLFKRYGALHGAGKLPALVLKNLTVDELDDVATAIADGLFPRSMLCEYHIAEQDSEAPERYGAQEQASERLAIRTVHSNDTDKYRASGEFGLDDTFDEITGRGFLPGMAVSRNGHACLSCGDDAGEALGLPATSGKPKVDRSIDSPNRNKRNGTDIDHIIVHYTTSTSIEGTISHFKNPASKVSAHYIIGRDGELVQMVDDKDRAWHAGNSAINDRSIGIEHVAKLGQEITPDQAAKSIALIKWLMATYSIPAEKILPHVCVKKSGTDCCGDLFKSYGGGPAGGCPGQKAAVKKWLEANNIE
jgi:N-acetylmuramoyl-L-alanine amidase/Fungal chitosanase of glycosyl hydrolase group 75